MIGLTLWQPYATLIAVGLKQYETRSWPPPGVNVGALVMIHAAGATTGPSNFARKVMADPVIGPALAAKGITYSNLPAGAVVAVARLDGFVKTDSMTPEPLEDAVGDWAPGRWAWRWADVAALDEPIPARGLQGLWRPALMLQDMVRGQLGNRMPKTHG